MRPNRGQLKEFIMNRRLVLAFLVAALMSLLTRQLSTAAPNDNSPVPVDEDPILIEPGADFGSCAVDIEIVLHGKGKIIDFPKRNRVITTSPGLNATVTNLADPSKRVSLNITGAFHETTEPDGSVVTVYTGRNLLLDPELGLVLVIGNFTFTVEADGDMIGPVQQGGRLIDVCQMLGSTRSL
jgi:hypothetical protein